MNRRVLKTTCYDTTTPYIIHVINQHDQSSNSSPLLELEVELKSRLAMAQAIASSFGSSLNSSRSSTTTVVVVDECLEARG